MSLQTHRGEQACTCDTCGEELKDEKGRTFLFDRDEFDVFLERLKEEGWKSYKLGEHWEHTCSDCQE